MKIKTGDKVKMLTGKDKGKTGKVLQVLPKDKKVVVEGLNLLVKNQRPRKQGQKGQRIQFPAMVAISNVALICSKCGQATRVGWQITATEKLNQTGKKVKNVRNRVCRKCKETI